MSALSCGRDGEKRVREARIGGGAEVSRTELPDTGHGNCGKVWSSASQVKAWAAKPSGRFLLPRSPCLTRTDETAEDFRKPQRRNCALLAVRRERTGEKLPPWADSGRTLSFHGLPNMFRKGACLRQNAVIAE